MEDILTPEVCLHRYFIAANRLRTYFVESLARNPPPQGTEEKLRWWIRANIDDVGIFMALWYGSLYVVIEGWRELGLSDPMIDPFLVSPHVENLRRYRNGAFHFQKEYFDSRFTEIMQDSASSVPWVHQLTEALGEYFLRTTRERNQKQA
ncbi:MAG TPA: hypothetical protein VMI53_05430 [Opitutaceae bacterium]|nr:hypothetical protein [Opitutaceae bacterium]